MRELRCHICSVLNIYNANNHSASSLPSEGARMLSKKPQYEKYADPTGEFTGQEMKYSFWYVRHRLFLHRLLIGVLIAVAAGTALFSLYSLGTYLIFGLQKSSEVDQGLTTFTNYTELQKRFAPESLQVLSTTLFSGGVGKYDMVAEVANPNSRFVVRFDYYFTYSGGQTAKQTTTFLPGEERPVAVLGVSGDVFPSNASLVIENIAWQRLSNHDYLDPAAFQSERLNFIVSNFEFLSDFDPAGANASTVHFLLTNQSAYSYKSARFYVGLYLDQSLVGVLPLTLDGFKAGESRLVDLRSFGSNLNVSNVKIFPLVNVYDQSLYLPPER